MEVDDKSTRDVGHDNVASLLPVLDGRMLDVDVTRTFGMRVKLVDVVIIVVFLALAFVGVFGVRFFALSPCLSPCSCSGVVSLP